MRCIEARFLLQQRHDAGQAPGAAPGAEDGALAGHLAECAECARFGRFLDGLGGEVRGALDAAATGMSDPDYAAVFSCEAGSADGRDRARLAPRRLRIAFAAAAAVLVTGVGLTGGVKAWVDHRDQARLAEQVSGFVDGMFAEPLLADAGLPEAGSGSGLRSWLEDTEASFLP